MAVEIQVPTMGESITEAVIASWLKHEGDAVNQGDALVELETDKVNLEVTADAGGVLQKIVKHEGDTVTIGEVLGTIGEGQAQQTSEAEASAQPQTDVSSSSQLQPSQVSQAQTSAAQSSSNGQRTSTPSAPGQRAQERVAATGDNQRAPSPLARRIAAEHNVDISQVQGHSAHGRVTKNDVISYMEQGQSAVTKNERPTGALPAVPKQPQPSTSVPPQPLAPTSQQVAPAARPAPIPVPQPAPDRREERVRMSRRRQTIARRLVEAQHTAAMLTTFNEIDMSAVMDVRSRRKEAFKERHNVSLGFMSFFTKATVGALKAFPRLNAEIQGDEMLLKHYYDIGIAVSAEEGLVVPVVRDADRKSFAEIEREIADLAKKARAGTLSLPELQGGTFTITNGGVFGSLLSTPILNGPQVGILGMHKIEQRPMAVNGQVVIRPMMYVALSYDHRIVDGSEAVQFLVKIKEMVEDPETLLLEG